MDRREVKSKIWVSRGATQESRARSREGKIRRTIAGSLELGIEIVSEGGIRHGICGCGQRSGAGNAGGMIADYHGR